MTETVDAHLPDDEEADPAPKSIQEITGIDFRAAKEEEKRVAAEFVVDTAEHELTIVRDDGIYRHLTARKPGTSMYWYEIVTWPGALVVRGDMGTYAFSGCPDMFGFFRSRTASIHSRYWAEKVIAHSGLRRYSEDSFRGRVAEQLADWVNDIRTDVRKAASAAELEIAALIEAVKDDVLGEETFEDAARQALDEFSHNGHEFSDNWEWDLNEYTTQFLWCLHAIVHAINEYDRAKGMSA